MKTQVKNFFNKKAMAEEYLPWILIGLAVLTILIISIFYLRTQGVSLIDKIKNMFKFG